MLFVRIVASPVLAQNVADAMHRHFASDGTLLACVSDSDINATVCSLTVGDDSLLAAVKTAAETIGVTQSVGRAFRIEIQHPDQGNISDDVVRSVAVELQGALRSSVYVARRSGMGAGQWSAMRAMGWGAQGLTLGDAAPALPFGGSESSGVAVEVGTPSVIAKARIAGVLTPLNMKAIAAACGSSSSGLVEAAVYPIGLGRDGFATFVIEVSDVKRSPLHRALALMDVEARHYGARLGVGALISDAPLELFLDTLAMHMGLPVNRNQVIETHLPARAAEAVR